MYWEQKPSLNTPQILTDFRNIPPILLIILSLTKIILGTLIKMLGR